MFLVIKIVFVNQCILTSIFDLNYLNLNVKDLDMKIQYKNRTYKQTKRLCCDCALAEWKVKSHYYYLDCPSFVNMNCWERGFKRKLFNDAIFKL